MEFNFEVHISLLDEKLPSKSHHTPFEYFTDLPVKCIPSPPKEGDYSVDEKCESVLDTLKITMEDARQLETNTRKQASCKEWFSVRESQITSSQVHGIPIRKRQFGTGLVDQFVTNEAKEKPDLVTKKLKHGTHFEPVARDKYKYMEILKFQESRSIRVRETGLVVNPVLFWLGCSPDGLVFDGSISLPLGCLEIKCPENMKNLTPTQTIKHPSFYIEMKDGKPVLKKNHSLGYYSQIQFQMGITQLTWIDFVVYFFKGIIITRVPFDEIYFRSLVSKSTDFYFKHWSTKQIPKMKLLNHQQNNLIRLASNFVTNGFLKSHQMYQLILLKTCSGQIKPIDKIRKQWYV